MNDTYAALDRAYTHALAWLELMPSGAVPTAATAEQLLSTLDGTLPEDPADPAGAVDAPAAAADSGLVATPSDRFFGFVIGAPCPERSPQTG